MRSSGNRIVTEIVFFFCIIVRQNKTATYKYLHYIISICKTNSYKKVKKMKKCIIDIETTTFLPWEKGRIICIGHKDLQTKKNHIIHDKEEKILVKKYIDFFEKEEYTNIIGYNVNYDIRFILSRLLKYKIPAPFFLKAKSIDIMAFLKGPNLRLNYNKPGTLNQWSKFVLDRTKHFHNKQIPDLFLIGRTEDILCYNKNDLELTFELYQRLQHISAGGLQ